MSRAPRLESRILDTVLVASNPMDGAFFTAISTVELEGPDGIVVPVSHGYATGTSADQELVDKSVSEAVERAVWHWFHDEGAAVGHSTIGCAVHTSPELAEAAALDEVMEKLVAVTRYRLGHLGDPREVETKPTDPTGPVARDDRTWHDSTNRLVIAGSFDERRRPRLVLASASYRDSSDVERAASHARAEIAQVLPWARDVAARGRNAVSENGPERKIAWWSEVTSSEAALRWNELTAPSTRHRQRAEEQLGVAVGNSSVSLSHHATISVGARELHFRRAKVDRWQDLRGIGRSAPDPFF